MAVLDRDEYLKRLGSIITGDTDEDLKNIEDFTDTFDDLLGKQIPKTGNRNTKIMTPSGEKI